MKATMDSRGLIILEAESGVEAYALHKWSEHAGIKVDDTARCEGFYWRGSALIVVAGFNEKED